MPQVLRFCHLLLTAGDAGALSSVRLEAPPVLTRCLACQLAKGPCEICLAREVQRQSDVDQGPVSSHQQGFGALETFRTDVLVRRLAEGGLEGAREMEAAQAGDRRQVVNRKIALQVGFHVVQHARQPAPIQSYLRRRGSFSGCRADMVLNQSRREAASQRFGKQPTGSGLGL